MPVLGSVSMIPRVSSILHNICKSDKKTPKIWVFFSFAVRKTPGPGSIKCAIIAIFRVVSSSENATQTKADTFKHANAHAVGEAVEG